MVPAVVPALAVPGVAEAAATDFAAPAEAAEFTLPTAPTPVESLPDLELASRDEVETAAP